MKIRLMAICALLALSYQVNAEGYAQTLKNSSVNHLQLILNNLNMLFLTQMDKQSDKQNPDEPRQTFQKFFESRTGSLVSNSFYQAPFSIVTKAKCDELAAKEKADINTTLPAVIRLVSLYDMTEANALELVNGMVVNVTIQAVENKDLSINCTK